MSLFTRRLVQTGPSHHSIAPHPRLRELRSSRGLFLLYPLALLIALLVVKIAAIMTFGSTSFSWNQLPPIPVALLWLCGVGFLSVLIRKWKHIEALRLAAVLGDQRLLADEQPHPNLETLQIPVQIVMRPSRRFLFVVSLIVIVLATMIFLLSESLDHLLDPFPWLWFLSLIAVSAIVIGAMFAVQWRHRWLVEATQEGIGSQVRGLGMAKSRDALILWPEAHLFACYPKPGLWNNSPVIIYELSSATHVVLWAWVQTKASLKAREEPVVPFEEHHAQIRALCELVAAKTGLPLYDLSRGQERP